MMQKIDFVIERAKINDAQAISVIEKNSFSVPWSANQIREEIAKDNCIFLCARCNDSVIGYISGQMILDEFYISNIAVSEDYRNYGVGNAIISELISELSDMNCLFATLEVRESNHVARKLYEKHGFENIGIRKEFYSHPKEDAIIYTLYFK